MKRILGIDYGEVRVGLAITDGLGITAQGMDTLVINGNNELFISSISNIIKEYDVADIVIGYPKNMNGTLSKKTDEIDNLIPKLENLGVSVYKIDERLTTVSSYKTMRELGISQKNKNKIADKLSAIYILEGFLNRQNYPK